MNLVVLIGTEIRPVREGIDGDPTPKIESTAEAGIEAETGPVKGTGPAAEIPETEKD